MTLHAQEAEMPLPSCPATRNRLEPQAAIFSMVSEEIPVEKTPRLGQITPGSFPKCTI